MRLPLGMWNYFHNFQVLKACQFFAAKERHAYFAPFACKISTHSSATMVWIDN